MSVVQLDRVCIRFPRPGRARVRAGTALGGLATLLVLAGCAADGSPVAAGWVEPAWMSTVRLELEEYQEAMVTCLADHGIRPLVTVGGLVVSLAEADEHGNTPPGWEELESRALEACSARVAEPDVWRAARDESAFQRELDVRDCLTYLGVEVSEPPTFEAWVEQVLPWGPYFDLLDLGLSADDLYALFEQCPQTGLIPIGINP